MKVKIKHDKEDGIFQTTINSEKAYLNYREKSSDKLEYYETFVPKKHRGKKVAKQLAKEALSFAKENNLKVILTCAFVKNFVKKNQKFAKIVVRE